MSARATLVRRLVKRLRVPFGLAVWFALAKPEQRAKVKFADTRAQWRRWYRVNKKYQRSLAALRRLGGRRRPIDPRYCSLPRAAVK